MMKRLGENEQRYALTNELHARPYARLEAPERASHFAFLSGEDAADASRSHLLALCDRYGIAHPPPDAAHFHADVGRARLKWERHTEFFTYTVFHRGPFDEPFNAAAAEQLPAEWLEEAPGELIVAVHVALTGKGHEPFSPDRLNRLFASESLSGSFVTDGAAQIWTDFRIHEDGFGHILVRDINLAPRQGGRLVQRLLEIETYRTMALLALPIAREIGPRLTRIDKALGELTDQMHRLSSLEDERSLLKRLIVLSSEIEGLTAGVSYRFSAARAYYALVGERIADLRETRAEGFQTVREFMERRLAPGMRTCESVVARQQALTDRANRAANLLRTRVDIELEGQNRDLLASMNRRAQLQLRLQQTVEGLSVAAITYYLVSLAGYAFKAVDAAGIPVDVDIGRALSIPVIAALVWMGVRRLRRSLDAAEKTE